MRLFTTMLGVALMTGTLQACEAAPEEIFEEKNEEAAEQREEAFEAQHEAMGEAAETAAAARGESELEQAAEGIEAHEGLDDDLDEQGERVQDSK